MADKPTDTKLVVIEVFLDSSLDDGKMSDCKATIYHVDGSQTTFSGWITEKLGVPISGGADFMLLVHDNAYDPNTNRTSVANWGLMFLPHGDPNGIPGSPLGSASFFGGYGATIVPVLNDFSLDLKGAKIKKRTAKYSWDWALAVQIVLTDGTTECFSSDPQMDVDQLKLTDEQLRALMALLAKPSRKAAAKPGRGRAAKKKARGKRR